MDNNDIYVAGAAPSRPCYWRDREAFMGTVLEFWREFLKLQGAGWRRWLWAGGSLLLAVLVVLIGAWILGSKPESAEFVTAHYKFRVSLGAEIEISGGVSAPVIDIEGVRLDGLGTANLQGILLSDRARWVFNSSQHFEDGAGRALTLQDFLQIIDDDELAGRISGYKETWALGLVSGAGNHSKPESAKLGTQRAIRLCEILASRPRLHEKSVNGVSLADSRDTSHDQNSEEEAYQRSVVIFGLIKETGNIDRQQLLQEIVQQDKILSMNGKKKFKTSEYELAKPGRRLEFFSADWEAKPVTCVP